MVQNEKKIRSGPLHKKCVSQDLYMPKRECSLLLYPVAVCHMKPNNPFSFIHGNVTMEIKLTRTRRGGPKNNPLGSNVFSELLTRLRGLNIKMHYHKKIYIYILTLLRIPENNHTKGFLGSILTHTDF